MKPTLLAKFSIDAPRDKDTGRPLGPVGQPRIQARIVGGDHIRTWTPSRADRWKRAISKAWDATGIEGPFAGPLRVLIKLRFQRPRSQFTCHGKGKNLRYDAPEYQTVRPDADNCLKAIMDCLQVDRHGRYPRRPWKNDWSICDVRVVKMYGRPGASIWIWSIGGGHEDSPKES